MLFTMLQAESDVLRKRSMAPSSSSVSLLIPQGGGEDNVLCTPGTSESIERVEIPLGY